MRPLALLPILAFAAVTTLVIAAPAAAAPYTSGDTIDIGDYTWQIQDDFFAVDEAVFDDGAGLFEDAWDDGYFSVFDDDAMSWNPFVCVNPDLSAPDTDGDVVVSCDSASTDIDLVVDGEIRLYGEGDLTRSLYTVTNPTGSAIEYSWEFYVDFGETDLRATTSEPTLGENDYVDTDFWSYNFSSGTLNGLTVWGQAGSAINHERVDDDNPDDLYVWNDSDDGAQLSLAPGESATFVFFQKVDVAGTIAALDDLSNSAAPVAAADKVENAPVANSVREDSVSSAFPAADATLVPVNAAAINNALSEFAVFDGRLVRGLPVGASVVNWQVAASTPELADTGADTTVTTVALISGASLLALGFLLLVVRRRKQTS